MYLIWVMANRESKYANSLSSRIHDKGFMSPEVSIRLAKLNCVVGYMYMCQVTRAVNLWLVIVLRITISSI